MSIDHTIVQEIDHLKQRLYDLQKRLVGSLPSEELPDGPMGLLLARVGEERVALPLESLEQVVPIARTTPIPECPPWVTGLLNIRGRMVPVIDVSARVERTGRRPVLSDLVVICELGERRVGLVVQQVEHVMEVSPAELVAPPEDIALAPYVLRMVQTDGPPLLLLSVSRLVETSELPVPGS